MAAEKETAPVAMRITMRYPDPETFVDQYWPNVSVGGIFIQSRVLQPVGTRVAFEIALQDHTPLMQGRARVSWIKEYDAARPDRPHGMGLRFIELDERSRDLLSRLVEKRDAHRGFAAVRLASHTVELQALAEEVEGLPTPPSASVQTDSPSGDFPSGDFPSGDFPSGDSPSGGSPSGGSGNGNATLHHRLAQAERELQALMRAHAIDEEMLEAALARARADRYDLGAIEELDHLLREELTPVSYDEAEAILALQQLLAAEPAPGVRPGTLDLPPERLFALERPRLAELAAARAPRPEYPSLAELSSALEPHDTDVHSIARDASGYGEPAAAGPAAENGGRSRPRELGADIEEGWRFSTGDFAAALAGQGVPEAPPQPAQEQASADEVSGQPTAFADSLFNAASQMTRQRRATRRSSEFDLSETGEHEALGPVDSGAAKPEESTLSGVHGQPRQQAPRSRELDLAYEEVLSGRGLRDIEEIIEEDVELVDDDIVESIEEVSEISQLVSRDVSSEDAPRRALIQHRNDRPPAAVAEEATLPFGPDDAPGDLQLDPSAGLQHAPAEPLEPKKKTRSSIFRRLLGRDETVKKGS